MPNTLPFQKRRAVLTPRSEKRVRAVLDAARQVFSEHGYEKSTTLDIAQRLGISEATIFTYFGSKRELCMQVISDWYGEISLELEQEIPLLEGTRSKLGHLVAKHLNVLIRDGKGLCALVLSEGRNPAAGFSGLIVELQRRYTAPLMAVLAAAQASGEVRADMPLRLMRDMVYGSMEHVLWDCIARGQEPDLDKTAHQIADLLWSAFAPPDRASDALLQFQSDVAAAMARYTHNKESDNTRRHDNRPC